MAETFILDPVEVATGRTEFEITPWVGISPDYGDSAIEAFMADQVRGATPIDFRIPNRTITFPLNLKGAGTVSADQARAKLQSKVARFQHEGGWLKRVTHTGGTYYADIVNASLTLGDQWMASHQDVEPGVVLTLECLPDLYGNEVQLSDHTETTKPEIVFTETGIDGDYPARVRIVVDEDDAETQRGVLWGFRSRHYSAASTARTYYEAEALQRLDTTTLFASAAASGGTTVRHGTISTSWIPILSTNIGGTAYMTHTGTNRVWARVFSTSGTAVQTRFVWDVGDLVNPAENPPVRLPGASNYFIVDLGEVRLDQSPVGTHRWQGQIQAKGDAGSESFNIDRLWVINQDEGAGALRAPLNLTEGIVAYSARSAFNTESGSITGDAATIGGNWTVVTNSDATDFSVGSGVATRTATSDTGTGAGIFVGRGVSVGTTNYTSIVVKTDFKADIFPAAAVPGQGIFARLVDSSNHLLLYHDVTSFPSGNSRFFVQKVIAGVTTTLGSATSAPRIPDDTFWTLRLYIGVDGFWAAWAYPQGAQPGDPFAVGQDSALATAGTLATGKVGIADINNSANASTRTFDNFAAWVPSADAVLFSSRSAQLTTQGHYRIDSTGTAYGPVSVVEGDLPRLPVAGMDGRTTEVFVKASRGDLDTIPDSGIDDISARVNYRPSWLFNPEP